MQIIPGGLEHQVFTEEDELLEENTLTFDDIKEENIQLKRKAKKSSCKAKTTCVLLGGSCVTNSTLCNGRLVSSGCKGTNCQCCVPSTIEDKLDSLEDELQTFRDNLNTSNSKLNSELQSIKNNMKQMNLSIILKLGSLSLNQGCPISKGYFLAPGSNQCLKVFLDTLRTWPQADAKCKSAGLVLVKPFDALALNKYMLERYYAANQWYWVNAKGDGSAMKWQRSEGLGLTKLENSSPLYTSAPSGSSVSTSYCLQMAPTTSYVKTGKVYVTRSCTGDREYALCELIMG